MTSTSQTALATFRAKFRMKLSILLDQFYNIAIVLIASEGCYLSQNCVIKYIIYCIFHIVSYIVHHRILIRKRLYPIGIISDITRLNQLSKTLRYHNLQSCYTFIHSVLNIVLNFKKLSMVLRKKTFFR